MALGKVPLLTTEDRVVNQLQTNIVPKLNQLLSLPLLQGNFLNDVSLSVGANTINHMLGRELLGWIITMNNSLATFYDSQETNTEPASTLILNASAAATVTLYVF